MVLITLFSYFSMKFDKHQRNYSTIKEECLALILALEHFDAYLGTTAPSACLHCSQPPHLRERMLHAPK